MPDQEILKALHAVSSVGGKFVFSIETPFGATERLATPEQAAAVACGELQLSSLLGLTPSEYSDWIAWGGLVQCSAKTAAGTRCRNVVTGPSTDVVVQWKARYDAKPYCRVHGGE